MCSYATQNDMIVSLLDHIRQRSNPTDGFQAYSPHLATIIEFVAAVPRRGSAQNHVAKHFVRHNSIQKFETINSTPTVRPTEYPIPFDGHFKALQVEGPESQPQYLFEKAHIKRAFYLQDKLVAKW